MAAGRVHIKVDATMRADDALAHHVLTLNSPRASWSPMELHDLAFTTADAAGLLSEETTSFGIEIEYVDAGASHGD
jgi:hypothetical protein